MVHISIASHSLGMAHQWYGTGHAHLLPATQERHPNLALRVLDNACPPASANTLTVGGLVVLTKGRGAFHMQHAWAWPGHTIATE